MECAAHDQRHRPKASARFLTHIALGILLVLALGSVILLSSCSREGEGDESADLVESTEQNQPSETDGTNEETPQAVARQDQERPSASSSTSNSSSNTNVASPYTAIDDLPDDGSQARAMLESEEKAFLSDGVEAPPGDQPSIRVANACGIEGLASDAKSLLSAQGYKGIVADNAAVGGTQDATVVVFRYAKDAAYAAKIAHILGVDDPRPSGFEDSEGNAVPIVSVMGPYGPYEDFGADILVIVGHDYYGGVYDASTGYWYTPEDAEKLGIESDR